jgi:hypothetical protein
VALNHRGKAAIRLTENDRRLLAFAAEHRFVLGVHTAALLETSSGAAASRLGRLVTAGCLSHDRRLTGPGAYQITRRGLGVIGSTVGRPREIDLGTYDHEVGLAWLHLAAQRGRFGPVQRIVSEREMRSHDRRVYESVDRLGIRLPGAGPHGGERRHYPDLLLMNASGRRVAIELELTPKGATRRREILGGYGIDARVGAVLYLVETAGMRRAIEGSAAAAGLSALIHVQPVRFGLDSGAIGQKRTGTAALGGRERAQTAALGGREPTVAMEGPAR